MNKINKNIKNFTCEKDIEVIFKLANDIYNKIQKRSLRKPLALIAKTIKGKGVSFVEGHGKWHHKIPNSQEMLEIMKELKS